MPPSWFTFAAKVNHSQALRMWSPWRMPRKMSESRSLLCPRINKASPWLHRVNKASLPSKPQGPRWWLTPSLQVQGGTKQQQAQPEL